MREPCPTTHTSYRENILTDLINALPGNSSVNAVQHATIVEAVFSMSSAPILVIYNGSINSHSDT
jgi:hypothetical protein